VISRPRNCGEVPLDQMALQGSAICPHLRRDAMRMATLLLQRRFRTRSAPPTCRTGDEEIDCLHQQVDPAGVPETVGRSLIQPRASPRYRWPPASLNENE
jgi:hypothetical protein